MKVFYWVSILTKFGADKNKVLECASKHMQFEKKDVDEDEETYAVAASFNSMIKPTEMRDRVRSLLRDDSDIHCVDVIYRFEHEMIPDRFVIWDSGRQAEYRGEVVFNKEGV